jgi:hypothetical protein
LTHEKTETKCTNRFQNQHTAAMPEKTIVINVLVEQKEGIFVARCLEMGLVATSLDERDAASKMMKMVGRQVEFAMKNERFNEIFRPVPNELWKKFHDKKSKVIDQSTRPLRTNGDTSLSLTQTFYAPVC